jgi:aryl carrier-like protein
LFIISSSANFIFHLNSAGIDEQRQTGVDNKLIELGLDSLNGIEVRQLLERHTRKSISLQQVQNITIKELKQLANHS